MTLAVTPYLVDRILAAVLAAAAITASAYHWWTRPTEDGLRRRPCKCMFCRDLRAGR